MKVVLNVGVIGCGYWGPNLIRNFSQMNQTCVTTIVDLDEGRLRRMKELYPLVTPTTNYQSVIHDPEIDIVAIATPVHTHFKLASEALAAGKHVFVEKPIAATVEEAEALVEMAAADGSRLMVGHTFLYTSAVNKMKQVIDDGDLGEVYYINSQRLNLGLFQQDINVIWDLATHDFSIILYLLGKKPVAVSAAGTAHINPKVEDVATVALYFDDDIIAFVQSSWLDPDKIRRMTIVGSKKMMVYDDIQPAEKIRIFDKSIEKPDYYDTFAEFPYSYKYGDILTPKLDGGEPVRKELDHFVNCILEHKNPLSDARDGLRVVQILEAAQQSLDNDGRKVFIE